KAGLLAGKKRLWSGQEPYTGWVTLPQQDHEEELERIMATAEKIKTQCNAFVVIGIGGSYLGARAAIEMLGGRHVYFAGQNMSGTYHGQLLETLKDKEVCLCVISKSGTTTEPSMAFAILKEFLYKKYGKEEAKRRIYAITDEHKGVLREEAKREGYTCFVVPDDIGGRYSVLTPVGLLPIAVAGIDIQSMLDGAKSALEQPIQDSCFTYAAVRKSLMDEGKAIEIFESYEPQLHYFCEWLKQLFGESEGKEGKGLFPASLQFSADLHSMGQFLQEGNQIFFETILNVMHPENDLVVPESAGAFLAGRSMNAVNKAAVTGVMAAHEAIGVPMIKLDIPALTPYFFGQMVYFFETSCALTGYLMGVNPFDQPGVESYKREMKKAL
ncbi:MAG: glucose-6-phosphate isomerase, partial [Anaerovorax sp.]